MKTRTALAGCLMRWSSFGRRANRTVYDTRGATSAATILAAPNRRALLCFAAGASLRGLAKAALAGVLLATLPFGRSGFGQGILNPSFEQVPIKLAAPALGQSSNPADVPGWTHSGPVGDALIWRIGGQAGLTLAGAGKQFVTLGTGTDAPGSNPNAPANQFSTWRTKIYGLIPGETYSVGFKIANEGDVQSQTIRAGVVPAVGGIGGALGTFTTTCGFGQYFWQCWEKRHLVFTALPLGGTTAQLYFDTYNQQYDIGLDDITIKKVPQTGGTWMPIAAPFLCLGNGPVVLPNGTIVSNGAGSALLLTDGRVLVHSEQSHPEDWCILAPDQFGDYVNGTWTTAASFTTLPQGKCAYGPIAFASAVLRDGRVIVMGGEFDLPSGCLANPQNAAKGAIYDPVLDKWSPVAPPPGWATIGDAQSAVLPDGAFILANNQTSEQAELTYPYSAAWVAAGTQKHSLKNDEEGWTLLPGPPDAEFLLTVNTSYSTCPTSPRSSEVYANGTWFCIDNPTPTQLWDNTLHEIGPAVLRPDGTVFQAGGTIVTGSGSGESAIFDSSTFRWTAGPNFPKNANGLALTIADGPAALLPNGNVLMMASHPAVAGAVFLELQYYTDILFTVSAPLNAPGDLATYGHMLVLPTGQIFFSDFNKRVEIYTPKIATFENSWRPAVQRINAITVANCFTGLIPYPPPPCLTVSQKSTNSLDGLQLSGMSQGAAYGDDYQSATNYPLVRITEQLGSGILQACLPGVPCPPPPKLRIYYCRTHDHSNMGVATGSLVVSTRFECPNVPINFRGYLEVVANGISGGGIPVVIGP